MAKTVAFDLDGTLIGTDSAQAWLQFLMRESVPEAGQSFHTCRQIMLGYETGVMDMQAYMQAWMAPIRGKRPEQLRPLLEVFVEQWIAPAIFTDGLRQLELHHKQGDQVLLISASPTLIVDPIARLLGVEHLIGIDVALQDGVLTDCSISPFSFREGKVEKIKKWLAHRSLSGLDVAYSDSINDVPMLSFATHGVCVNPDPGLAALAANRAWSILVWQATTGAVRQSDSTLG